MELSEVMRTMSGVRRYLREDVPDEVIYAALDDARFAPSGGNRQPWRVVVIRNLDLRKKVSEVSSRGMEGIHRQVVSLSRRNHRGPGQKNSRRAPTTTPTCIRRRCISSSGPTSDPWR